MVSSLGARIDKLEGALDGEIRGRVRGVEDGVGKIKVAVVKLTKSVQEGEGNREGTIGEEGEGERRAHSVNIGVEDHMRWYFRSRCALSLTAVSILTLYPISFRDSLRSSQRWPRSFPAWNQR